MKKTLERSLPILLVLTSCFFGAAVFADDDPAKGEIEWRYASRDIYLAGELRSDVMVLSAEEPDRLAFLVPGAAGALVVEAAEDALSLSSIPAADFTFDQPTRARSPEPSAPLEGRVTELPDGLLVHHGEHQLVVLPHQGPGGELEIAELWRQAPVWRQLYDAYEPDPEAVEALRNFESPVRFTVAFGTWCGDSRRSVPRFLKTLEAAGNDHLAVRLVAIQRGFLNPLDFAREHQITNVPTIIAREHEREIGRFVESPRSEVVETDVAAILSHRPLPPADRFRDSDGLLASATLGVFEGGRRIGEERWRFYTTDSGGHRLWTRQRTAHGLTESWQSFDEQGASTFVEVTRSADDEFSRTRLWRNGDTARSTTRGDVTGIVKQTVDLTPGAVLLAPGVAGVAQAWRQAGRPADTRHLAAHRSSAAGEVGPGKVGPISLGRLPDRRLELPGGSLTAVGVEVGAGDRSGRYWLHPELDLPVLVELDDGRRLELESLDFGSLAVETPEG